MANSEVVEEPKLGQRRNADLQIGDSIKITVETYDRKTNDGPVRRSFLVPYTREMRVLEALDYIVEELGETLAYQWFCGVKKCGMCGMLVNGRQTLACWEPVQREMLIQPLPNFPVIRDLVVDRQSYFDNIKELKPLIDRSEPYKGFPEPVDPAVMVHPAKMAHCIECMLCVSACPAVSDEFMGPAPMVQLARLALDPRDGGDRAGDALDPGGIEHCVSCRQCSRVCPSGIPVYEMAIGSLRREIDERNLAPRGFRDRTFANIHRVARIGSALAPVSNWLLGSAQLRRIMQRFLGIDARRPLPRFASTSFENWFVKRKGAPPRDKKVVLFHDTFTNFYEPRIGAAAVKVFEHLGFEVLLAQGRKCCGRPMLSKGLREHAKETAAHNVELLAGFVRQDIPIVVCEPSCATMLQDEYPRLLDTPDARLVAVNVFTFEQFVEPAVAALGPLGGNDMMLVHGHCQQKAVGGMAASIGLLSGLGEVQEVPSTCCGMAGSNGYEAEHYDRSMEAGERSLFPHVRNAGTGARLVAAGTSCRQQIKHGTGRSALHPAELIWEKLSAHGAAAKPDISTRADPKA